MVCNLIVWVGLSGAGYAVSPSALLNTSKKCDFTDTVCSVDRNSATATGGHLATGCFTTKE